MRTLRNLRFNLSSAINFKKKNNNNIFSSDDDDDDYNNTSTVLGRKNSTYFPTSIEEEVGRKKRRRIISALLTMTLTDELQTELLYLVSQCFDLPLVIGEQFICKIAHFKFQSASYHNCLQFILTTLFEEEYPFAIKLYDILINELNTFQKCQLASIGFDIRTRTYRFREYKNCFIGRDSVNWLLNNRFVLNRNDAIKLGQLWDKDKLISHVTKQHPFCDSNYFYRFNDHLKLYSRFSIKAIHLFTNNNDKKQLYHINNIHNKNNSSINNNNDNINVTPNLALKNTPSYSSRFVSKSNNNNNNIYDVKIESPTKKSQNIIKKTSLTLRTIYSGY